MKKICILSFCTLLFASITYAAIPGKNFDRIIFVLFENENFTSAARQPFFKELAQSGANFTNFLAETHPSQGNYIALTSGSVHGVTNDNSIDLRVQHIADLLEQAGLNWKVYAEDYPGNCFLDARAGDYARKHVPFLSYTNIQQNPERCAHIVNAEQFDIDAAAGQLPEYSFYIPNMKNDGHDTNVGYADRWYRNKFGPYVNNETFMAGTVLVSTFDESGISVRNQIYTSIVGPNIRPGNYSALYNHYSLLQLVEENWNLGNLGLQDVTAKPITGIWK